ncbi:hypothetical protein RDI58_001272 [Solanum bulbocastanum]|uniref:Uncharacterized protein n=1 Tax=Solanum bulbocastanum TaxID=147425 RepID=A0AAN8YN20_SOLBU
MDSRDASIFRSLCPQYNRLESSKGEFTTSDGGGVSWVDNETLTEWPIFVDLQLRNRPLAVEGEKHNNTAILLSDDEYGRKIRMLDPFGGLTGENFSLGTCRFLSQNNFLYVLMFEYE